MPGHYVGEGEPVVDVDVGIHRLTLCAPFAGKIMRGTELGTVVKAGEMVTELTGVGRPTWELFVAYRRKDAPGHAGRLGERLIRHFGSGQVFKDIESLPPGVNFPEFIREKLKRAFVMVVIIGPSWASNPRLQDPSDLHREEIATAFKRAIRVFPVLVDGATMPQKAQLPDEIRGLADQHAVEITDTRWDYDTGLLVEHLTAALMDSPRRTAFLAQVPPWGDGSPQWQWVMDEPWPDEPPQNSKGQT